MRRAIPFIMFVLMELTLISLGVWQLQRKEWKEALLAQRRISAIAPPLNLTTSHILDEKNAYRLVSFECQYDAFTSIVESGFDEASNIADRKYILCNFKDAPSVVVRSKWAKNASEKLVQQPKVAFVAGPLLMSQIVKGRLLPWPSQSFYDAWIGPGYDRQGYWNKNHKAPVASYFVQSGDTVPPPPANNHFAYAMQWFIFAGVLLVIFTIWARRQRLAPPGPGA
jgi:surfeit locus 1 family protein